MKPYSVRGDIRFLFALSCGPGAAAVKRDYLGLVVALGLALVGFLAFVFDLDRFGLAA